MMRDASVEGRMSVTIKNTFVEFGPELSHGPHQLLARRFSSEPCLLQKASEEERRSGVGAEEKPNALLTELSDAETDSCDQLSDGLGSSRSSWHGLSSFDSESSAEQPGNNICDHSTEKKLATTELEEAAKRLALANAELVAQNHMLSERIVAMSPDTPWLNTAAYSRTSDFGGLGDPQEHAMLMMWTPVFVYQPQSTTLGEGDRWLPKKAQRRKPRKCKSYQERVVPQANDEETQIHEDTFALENTNISELASDATCDGESSISEDRTTIMLQNLPNNYTRSLLLRLIDGEGFRGCYDFVYLPIDFLTRACLGYAFINMTSTEHAQRLWKTFKGFSRWAMPSRKLCGVRWSDPHQGFQSNVERYRNSPVMHETVPDEFKPMVFVDGVEAPFPAKTKKSRAPRMKTANRSFTMYAVTKAQESSANA